MAKKDKLEQKYYEFKSIKFNKEQDQNYKNAYRAKIGKLNAEEFSIKNDESINDEEKQKRLAEIKREKKIFENLKNNEKNAFPENLRAGFSKNEEAIDRILSLRDNAKEDIKKLENDLKKAKEQIEKHKEVEKLEARLEAGKETNSTMSNEEYLALASELKEKRANLGEKPNVEKLEKQVASKRMMVTKCNLAWKCLFRNETWNDIHMKAVRINSQKKEKQEEIKQLKDNEEKEAQQNNEGNEKTQQTSEENKEQNENTQQREKIGKRIEKWFFAEEDKEAAQKNEEKEQEDEKTEQESDKKMAVYDEFARKHPVLAKIRDAFKNRFGKKKENNTQNHKIEQQEEQQEQQQEQQQEKKRDLFIEELKSYAEKGNSQQNLNQKYAEKLEKTNSIDAEKIENTNSIDEEVR